MPLITTNNAVKKEKIKAEISVDTLNEIQAYCAWAGIDKMGFFIEEAASYVFNKDRDWKQHKRAERRQQKAAETA